MNGMLNQELPNFHMSVGDLEDEENVYITSLVKNPATDMRVQVFSKVDNVRHKLQFQHMPGTPEYERIISGVWMMPDTKYYRIVDGFEFTVSFTKEDLKKALVNYLKNDKANSFDLEHSGQYVSDMISLEHWIIEDSTTASPVMGYTQEMLGYSNLPVGTVMKTVYVKDAMFFEQFILSGKVNGFSIEGLFYMNQQSFSKMIAQTNKFTEMFKSLGLDNQKEGTLITELGNLSFSLEGIKLDGVEVIDAEYVTKQNFSVVIRQGKLVNFGFNEVTPVVAEVVVQNTVIEPTVETPQEKVDVVTSNTDILINITPEQIDKAFEDTQREINLQKEVEELKVKLTEKEQIANQLKQAQEESDKMKKELDKLKEDMKAEADKKAKANPIKGSIKPLPVEDNTKFITRTKNGVDYKIPVK